MIRRLPLLGVLLLALAAAIGGVAPDGIARRGEPGVVIVAVNADVSVEEVTLRVEARGYTVRHSIEDLHALEASGEAPDSKTLARQLAAIPGVRYAEPVVTVTVSDSPSDPLFTKQSAYLSAVNAQQAWDIEQGKPDIVVAVIDTGVDILHPDLKANIVFNPAEIPNNATDDDGNGCVDDVNGCAFVSDSSPGCENTTNGFVNDDIGHGTFVAGVIAAAANGTGIVGVARNVKIMPVKVLDCHGVGDSVATARGITYAARNGARVINLSLGGLQEAQVVVDAIDEATRDGVLVVAAAGNGGTAGVSFPARVPEVLAVGAAAQNNPDRRAAFSSFGPEVDVVAVGENIIGPVPASRCDQIFVCVPGAGPFATGNGTSFSTPQASGLAALMLSVKHDLTPSQITDIIKESATALPPGDSPGWAGDGRINMLTALKAVQANHPPGDTCTIESVTDGERFTCAGGRHVQMLQAHTPALNECGGDWAKSASQFIFLTPGRTVYLRYDVNRASPQGDTLAAPIWRGADGADYNLALVMVYVGLARAKDVGAGNVLFHDWALSSEHWASAAQWNMWAPGKPFNGGPAHCP
jgi:subtilisin family serine protease